MIKTHRIFSLLWAIFFVVIFNISPALSQENIPTNQAIDQIERSLLSGDDKNIISDTNSGVRVGRPASNTPAKPQIEMVIVDAKDNRKTTEKQKLAYAAMLVDQYEVALELYKEVVKAEPKNNYAKFGMAVAYHKLGQYRQAKTLYSALLKSNPANKEEVIGNFLEVIVEESPNDAVYLLAKLSAENPKSSYILARSAMAYDKIHRSDDAAMLMRRAIAIDPTNTEYKFNLAVIYDKMKNYQNALNFYQQVVSSYVQDDDITQSIPITEVKRRIDYIQNLEANS